jgi:hydrogenase expression/formation protein HypC
MCLAIPGKIISIQDDNGIRLGRVQFGGITQPVSLDFLPEAVSGDYVLVHVGFAISRVNQEEAERTWQALEELGLLAGELPVDDEIRSSKGEGNEIPGRVS